MEIRQMLPSDWNSVRQIYESGIVTHKATFETSVPSYESWDKVHLNFGRLVAIQDNEIVGWAALTSVSNRCVYGGVAEVSIYIHENFRGKGIGKKLLAQLITESEAHDIWTLQAGIFVENTSSVALHEKSGFRIIGIRERIGKLNGEWRSNYLLERRSNIVGVD